MELTWHGHSTWKVTTGDTTLLIDPNFASRFTDIDPSAMESPDYLLLTHGHMDHIKDVPEFADSTIVATPEVSEYVAQRYDATESVFNFGMNMGGSVAIGDAHVSMHEAKHTNEIGTDYGDRSFATSGGIPVGFTVSDAPPSERTPEGSTTFYHAGDTALSVSMRDIIGSVYQPDAAAVPIGGSFTMGPMEAAVAVDWLNVAHAFPMHYNTAPPIYQDPSEFENRIEAKTENTAVHILGVDDSFELK